MTKILFNHRKCYICVMEMFPKKLSQRLMANALRSLPQPKPLVNLSSNDYLVFSNNQQMAQSTLDLLQKYMKA